MPKLLEIEDLNVTIGHVNAVRGINFHINEGEILALVGESGCGKSVTAKTILKLIDSPPLHINRGHIWFDQQDLLALSEKELEKIRGNRISMIFQDPMSSLNPTMKIGTQIMECFIKHQHLTKSEAREKAIEMLEAVGIPNPNQRIDQYPFEFSGGMRQRVMIAIALACKPALLLADEPTTALDVTIQAQILDLLFDLKKKLNMSILLITHDLGIVAGMADRVIVMYAGEVMETGTVDQIFYQPKHPYTQALLKTIPRLGERKEMLFPIIGSPPDLTHPPGGCPFHARCNYAMKVCERHRPPLFECGQGQTSACWLHHDFARKES